MFPLRITAFRSIVLPFTFLLAAGSVSSGLQAAPPASQHPFHIESEWNLGGAGGWGWLALDPVAHQLYIPRTNRVMVVDTRTGKISGEVNGFKNLRDIVLDDSGKYGYVTDPTDGSAGFVHVFDRTSLKLVTSIPTGQIPAAIVFDPAAKRVFAFNSHSHSATVIDTATNQVTSTIPLASRPGTAVADGRGAVFVTLPALGVIARIDAATAKLTASWQLAPCTGPSGLAIDVSRRQLFTTCEDHKLVAINADTGRVAPIGDAPAISGDLDFNPRTDELALADAAGSVTLFHRDASGRYSLLQQVKTQPGARTMIVDHNDNKVYLVTSRYGQRTGPVSEELEFRPTPIPGTFSVIVVGQSQ
jgi:YVTN family beta-propeller protein